MMTALETLKRAKVGVVIYKDADEDGTVWYVAVEPVTGA